MGENKVNEREQTSEVIYQTDLSELEHSLQGMKNELEQGNKNVEHDPLFAEKALSVLTQKITLLVGKEGLLARQRLAERPELVDLMHEIIRNIQGVGVNKTELVSMNEEGNLLVELMYEILADLGRRKSEQEVQQLSKTALSFYTRFGIGGVYERLLKNAHVA